MQGGGAPMQGGGAPMQGGGAPMGGSMNIGTQGQMNQQLNGEPRNLGYSV